jgi:alpha-ribazole phosphatase
VVARPTRWWWIRHAPCDGPPGLIHGRDVGIVKDERQIARVKALLPDPALFLTSAMKRAIDSARALSHVPAQKIAAFDEQDFGDWQGRAHAELWDSGDAAYRDFWKTPADSVPPGGESFASLVARVSTEIARLTELHQGMDLVAIAHAGPIRAALAVALGLSPERALAFAIDHWSVTRLDFVAGSWRVGGVNG